MLRDTDQPANADSDQNDTDQPVNADSDQVDKGHKAVTPFVTRCPFVLVNCVVN